MPDVDTRYGRLAVPDTDTDVIGRFLSRYGEWAWCEASFAASVVKDGARVLDVGAFVGTFGLGVALSRPLGFLGFVEANPLVARLLEGNVTGKTTCPVAVVEALVAGPETRPRAGHGEPGNLGSTSFHLDSAAENAVPAPVRAVTLAALRAQYGAFDLIKLDVEGMEMEALLGDADHLAKGQTALWIECNEDRRSLNVAQLLLSWNLKLFYFAFPSYNPENFNADPEAVFPFAYEAALLAAPVTDPVLTADLLACGCILRPLHSLEDLREALWHTPRWGMPEWEHATTRQDLAALVGRSLRGESFDKFLNATGPTAPDQPLTIWQRLEATEAGLRHASELAIARLDDVTRERAVREAAEAGLRFAEKLVAERSDEVTQERERREAAEAGLRFAEKLVAERSDEVTQERERREAAEAELRFAEKLVAERSSEVTQERERRARVEDGLRAAQALAAEEQERVSSAERELAKACARALAHLSALGEARDRNETLERDRQTDLAAAAAERRALREYLEARVEAQEELTRGALRTINEIQASTMWRIGAPVRALVGGRPTIRAVVRRCRAGAGSMLRRWRG